ncbi:hypothetical protein L1887_05086 [Cichorium endivia]|nr:hypothetical protein L1887_05086 [Cichorium endivia]
MTSTTGKFIHLLVVENGEVIAILDIAKCLYDAIARMERAAEKGKAIAAAVEGVEKHWGTSASGCIEALASIPPTPHPATPNPFTILECESVPKTVSGYRMPFELNTTLARETTALTYLKENSIGFKLNFKFWGKSLLPVQLTEDMKEKGRLLLSEKQKISKPHGVKSTFDTGRNRLWERGLKELQKEDEDDEREIDCLDFGLFCEHFYLVIYAPLTLGFHSSHSTISSQLRVSVPRSLKSTTGIFRTLKSN